jgi:hypothetical protein
VELSLSDLKGKGIIKYNRFTDSLQKIEKLYPEAILYSAIPSPFLKFLRIVPVGVRITGSLKIDCGLMF